MVNKYTDLSATNKMITNQGDNEALSMARVNDVPYNQYSQLQNKLTANDIESKSINNSAELYNSIWNNPPRDAEGANNIYKNEQYFRNSALSNIDKNLPVDNLSTMGSDSRIYRIDNPISQAQKDAAWRQSEATNNALVDSGFTPKTGARFKTGPNAGTSRPTRVIETPETARTYEIDPITGEYGAAQLGAIAPLAAGYIVNKYPELNPIGIQAAGEGSDVVPQDQNAGYNSLAQLYKQKKLDSLKQ